MLFITQYGCKFIDYILYMGGRHLKTNISIYLCRVRIIIITIIIIIIFW